MADPMLLTATVLSGSDTLLWDALQRTNAWQQRDFVAECATAASESAQLDKRSRLHQWITPVIQEHVPENTEKPFDNVQIKQQRHWQRITGGRIPEPKHCDWRVAQRRKKK